MRTADTIRITRVLLAEKFWDAWYLTDDQIIMVFLRADEITWQQVKPAKTALTLAYQELKCGLLD